MLLTLILVHTGMALSAQRVHSIEVLMRTSERLHEW